MPHRNARVSQVLCCQVECLKLLAVILLCILCIFLHKFLQVLPCLKVLSAAVNMHKLVHSQVTTTHPDNNIVTLNLHEHSSSMVPVNPLSLSLEGHSTPDRKRLFVDDVLQFLVDSIFLHRFVGAHIFLDLLARDFEV